MSRRVKSLTAAVGALMLTAMMVVLISPFVVDSNFVRAQAIALVETRTGLDVRIEGGVHLQWLPTVRVTASDVRAANPSGFASQDLARIGSLTLTPALGALLRGRFESARLDLDDVSVFLERDAAGSSNWSTAARALRGASLPAEEDDAAAPATTVIGALNVHDMRVVWRDAHDTTTLVTVATIDVQTGAIDAHGGIRDLRVHASLPTGAHAHASLIEAHGELANGRLLAAELDANLRGADTSVRMRGALRGDLHTGQYRLENAHAEGDVGRARHPIRFDADVVVDADSSRMLAAFDFTVEAHPATGKLALDWSRQAMDASLELGMQLGDAPGPWGLRGRNVVVAHARINERSSADDARRISALQVIADVTDASAPDGRLRVTLDTDVEIDAQREHIRAGNLRLQAHDNVIAGYVEVRGFDAPAVRFDLEADAIDAERMLPVIGARLDDGHATSQATPVRTTLEAIRAMDVAGEMRVDTLALRGMRLENVRLVADGGAKGGQERRRR
ncbi:MAG: AsmA family protein [Gammaproteobacteria bacterium]|nr:AsmA family protein [Gammaproteobacteria bacterium]